MGMVLWHVTMSLDGFIAGPGDAMDWVLEHDDPAREFGARRRRGLPVEGTSCSRTHTARHEPPAAASTPL